MLNFFNAIYKVAKDKTYDYLTNNKETSTDQRLHKNISYWNQYTTFFSEPTHIIDNIYIGSAFNAASYDVLKKYNISIILNITNEISEYYPNDFVYKTYKIYDDNKDDITKYLSDSYNYIEENKERNILVHCYMGASRSVSIVINYLMKKHNMSFNNALDYIKEKRPSINPSIKYVENLHSSNVKKIE